MNPLRIVLRGTPRPVAFCPVSVRAPRSPADVHDCELVDVARQMTVPFQVESAAEGAILHWIVDALAAGQEKEYELCESAGGVATAGVKLDAETPGRVSVSVGGELLTNYLYGEGVPKPCLYPLTGPFGDGVTRAYPQEQVEGDSTDHVHHRSVWASWGDVNGSDNWGEADGHGRMVHRRFDATESGAVLGRIVSLNDWLDGEGNRLMQDRLEYRFYNVPPSFRLFDMALALHATDGDVRFGDTKEGGMISVRVATPLEVKNTGRIENSLGGTNEDETWGKRASWCDYSGVVGGHRVGIAVFDHPTSFRYPTYWHVRNYGLMTANPFGISFFEGKGEDGSYVLPAGEKLCFRYRVLVHAGDAREGAVGQKYLEWLYPPVAEVIS